MRLTIKDAAATVFSALAVLAFVTTHEGWNVALIGDNHRWAALAVLLLGLAACTVGARADAVTSDKPAGVLGGTAMVLGIVAIATGSLTPLSLLVVDIVVLWAVTTYRHAVGEVPHRSVPASP